MALTKTISVTWHETGASLYCIVRRLADSFYLNDANGAFAAAPADSYLALMEDVTTPTLYTKAEARTVWPNGFYEVLVYRRVGGSPDVAIDLLVASGTIEILADAEVVATGTTQTDARTVVNRSRQLASDKGLNTRYPDDVMRDWLNAGQLEVGIVKPNAVATSASVQLVTGAKQTLPADGFFLIDVVRNMGADGKTPGRAIVERSKGNLDRILPNWNAGTTGVPKHFMYDEQQPLVFWVYPPANAQYAEILYSKFPTAVADLYPGTPITISAIYANALSSYICSRIAEEERDKDMAVYFYSQFLAAITGKATAEEVSKK
jgi:hypothetical protein